MPSALDRLRLAARARRRGQVQPSPLGFSPLPPLISDIPTAEHLSLVWRLGETPSLRRRRHAATTALASATIMAGLSLYQMGVIRRLPEVPVRGFEANIVDASAQAYQLLGSPDATLGVVSYSVTAALAGMGGRKPPLWLNAALAGKAAIDLGWAAKLTADQATKHRAACSWCLMASTLTLATFVSAARELRAGWLES